MSLFGNGRKLQLQTSKLWQKPWIDPTEGALLRGEGEEVGRDCLEGEPSGRKARVQGADGFSLAQLLASASGRRCDVLFLLGPVAEDSLLLGILPLGSNGKIFL